MRFHILMFGILGLAACNTPREGCIIQATIESDVLQNRIEVQEALIARGSRVEDNDFQVRYDVLCSDSRATDYNPANDRCFYEKTIRRSRVVEIDQAEERAELARLQAELNRIAPRVNADVEQCKSYYPE